MTIRIVPSWMEDLEEEDVAFIKNLVLTSGSLKDMAAKYGVTYPTVRLRLDRLIEKIRMHEDEEQSHMSSWSRNWLWTTGWISRPRSF